MGVTVHFQKLSHFGDLELPGYATDQSAGMDLRAAVAEPVILNPGDRRVIPCGFSMELPAGFEAQVRPRSGLAAKNGVTVLNAPGTIDADYRGEVMVILVNHGQESFTVHRGDRIAQMIIAPVSRVEWEVASSLSVTRRGEGGFGHTGKH
ncbi:MAG: dUTP diphosphatase [Bacteroidetes bacterium]|nr:dUTP diphosphatase [Bacteroidota bacterium]